MDSTDIILRIISLNPFIFAASFLAAGGWIIIRSQPLIFRASVPEWLSMVAVLPLLGLTVYTAIAYNSGAACLSVFMLGLLGILAYVIRRDSVEFMVIAVREEALHAALRTSLTQLDVPYVESVAGFVLPALNDTLLVRFQMRMGAAQLRMKSRQNFPRLTEIVQATRANLKAERESVMIRDGWIYLALGLFMLVFALSFFQQR